MKKWAIRAGIMTLATVIIQPLTDNDYGWFDLFGMSILTTLNITFVAWIISLFGLKKWFWRILDIILGTFLVLYLTGQFL